MSGKNFLQLVNDKVDAGETIPCLDKDPEDFFPNLTSNEFNLRDMEAAKAVCRKCPVIAECLNFAMDTDDRWAVMGGTSPADRTIIAMKRETRAEKQRRQSEGALAEALAFAKERHQVMGVAA